MFTLDEDFLTNLGLGALSDEDKQAFLEHLYQELELRVGTELSRGLSDQQLANFEKLLEDNKQEESMQWLEQNCPGYKEVVAAELDKLKEEITNNREQILGEAA